MQRNQVPFYVRGKHGNVCWQKVRILANFLFKNVNVCLFVQFFCRFSIKKLKYILLCPIFFRLKITIYTTSRVRSFMLQNIYRFFLYSVGFQFFFNKNIQLFGAPIILKKRKRKNYCSPKKNAGILFFFISSIFLCLESFLCRIFNNEEKDITFEGFFPSLSSRGEKNNL